jgi:DinB superfamily
VVQHLFEVQPMNAITYLQKIFANINANYHGIVGDFTEKEWVSRPVPGQNMVGYIAWHIPRTQDMQVQTWIRGVPEVVQGERWMAWRSLKGLGSGVGISLDEADQVARLVKRVDVIDYADAVLQEISGWLEGLNESDLDLRADYVQRMTAYPEYQTSEFIEEVRDLLDQPTWGLLMRPCFGHIHRHLGELEAVKSILRSRA